MPKKKPIPPALKTLFKNLKAGTFTFPAIKAEWPACSFTGAPHPVDPKAKPPADCPACEAGHKPAPYGASALSKALPLYKKIQACEKAWAEQKIEAFHKTLEEKKLTFPSPQAEAKAFQEAVDNVVPPTPVVVSLDMNKNKNHWGVAMPVMLPPSKVEHEHVNQIDALDFLSKGPPALVHIDYTALEAKLLAAMQVSLDDATGGKPHFIGVDLAMKPSYSASTVIEKLPPAKQAEVNEILAELKETLAKQLEHHIGEKNTPQVQESILKEVLSHTNVMDYSKLNEEVHEVVAQVYAKHNGEYCSTFLYEANAAVVDLLSKKFAEAGLPVNPKLTFPMAFTVFGKATPATVIFPFQKIKAGVVTSEIDCSEYVPKPSIWADHGGMTGPCTGYAETAPEKVTAMKEWFEKVYGATKHATEEEPENMPAGELKAKIEWNLNRYGFKLKEASGG